MARPPLDPHAYPLRLYVYDEGLYVQAIETAHAEAVGGRVTAIGGVEVDEALRRVGTLIPADNRWGVRKWAPLYFAFGEVLHALDLSDSRTEATFTVETAGGGRHTVTLAARSPDEVQAWVDPDRQPDPSGEGYVTMRPGPAPLWLRDPRTPFWMERLPDGTLFVQVNRLRDAPDEPIRAFFDRVLASLDAEPTDRLVLDLRHNSGGNHVSLPLIHGLIRRPEIDRRGHLFVLIGRGTFSAAQNLVSLLETHTNAVFVGEPTAQRPNHYGVVGAFELPHSGLRVGHSRYLIQDVDPADYRLAKAPDLYAPPTPEADAAGRDPALEAVLAYGEAEPLPPDHLGAGLGGRRVRRGDGGLRPAPGGLRPGRREHRDGDEPDRLRPAPGR